MCNTTAWSASAKAWSKEVMFGLTSSRGQATAEDFFDGATTLLTASGWAIPRQVDFLCLSETKVTEPLRLSGAKAPTVGSLSSPCRVTAKGAHSGGGRTAMGPC